MTCPICDGTLLSERAPSDKPYRYDHIYCEDCTANFEPDVRADDEDLTFLHFECAHQASDRMKTLAFGPHTRRSVA